MTITPVASSTNFNPVYAFSQFVPIVTSDYNGNTIEPYFDIFSPKMINGINAITVTGFIRNLGEPITTTANNQFANTTCWWMLCLASGITQPLRTNPGTKINLPLINNIVASLDQQQNTSSRNINTVVI